MDAPQSGCSDSRHSRAWVVRSARILRRLSFRAVRLRSLPFRHAPSSDPARRFCVRTFIPLLIAYLTCFGHIASAQIVSEAEFGRIQLAQTQRAEFQEPREKQPNGPGEASKLGAKQSAEKSALGARQSTEKSELGARQSTEKSALGAAYSNDVSALTGRKGPQNQQWDALNAQYGNAWNELHARHGAAWNQLYAKHGRE